MWDTLLIDGTDVKVAGVRQIRVWSGISDVASLRGGNALIPLADGETWVEKPFDTYTLPLDLVLLGSGRQAFNDARRTLLRLVKPGRTVTLSRRVGYGTGNETHTALAEYATGLNPSMTGLDVGQLLLEMRILGGLWYGAAVTIGAGASTITGDVRTRRMTATVSAGMDPTVTNTTNGYAFTVSGDTTTPVEVDVEAMTASDSGGDCSDRLSWTRTWPMQLEAGSNTLTISSGTLSVEYQPAYL